MPRPPVRQMNDNNNNQLSAIYMIYCSLSVKNHFAATSAEDKTISDENWSDLHFQTVIFCAHSDRARKKKDLMFEEWKFNGRVTMFEKYKEQKMQDRYALPLFSVQEQSLWINEYNDDVNSKIKPSWQIKGRPERSDRREIVRAAKSTYLNAIPWSTHAALLQLSTWISWGRGGVNITRLIYRPALCTNITILRWNLQQRTYLDWTDTDWLTDTDTKKTSIQS